MNPVRDAWRKLKGAIGNKVYGLAFNIDIVDGGCPVNCPSCAVGSIGRRRKHFMDIDLFRKILDKAQSECKVRNVQLYAYGEPATHPDLHLFVQECTDRGIPAIVSTVLQHYRCDWAKVVEARPREIRISFPGWSRMSYYQGGAKPERFDANFAKMMELPRYPETVFTLGYHVYADTVDEMPAAIALADKYRLKFVPINAIYMANDRNADKSWSEKDRELISHLLESPEQEIAHYIKSDFCYCQSKQITISATGAVWLCQLTYYDKFQLAPSFLDVPLKEVRRQMKAHEFCTTCKAAGGNVYQEAYGYWFEDDDPVAKANKGRLK